VSKFHSSPAWRKLSLEHKTFRCACKSKDDIQSAHYLPQKRFPLMRLWKANLYISCGKCNRELGDKIYWSPQAIKLLGIYAMIKFITYLITIITLALLARYYYLDTEFNNSTITDQIRNDANEIYNYIVLNDNWML